MSPSQPHATPNQPKARPKASMWNMVALDKFALGFALAMSISSCLCKANTVSGGIWAL